MPVNTLHQQFAKLNKRWQMMRDVTDGESAVKAKGEEYLPKPNKQDNTPANRERYKQYIARASFLEVTKDTLDKYTGQAFATDPALVTDSSFDYLKTNANGEGATIYQLAQKVFIDQMRYGRCGLLIDCKKSISGLSQADVELFDLTPKIKFYDVFSIINWRITDDKLSMLVLREDIEQVQDDDIFVVNHVTQYRCFTLEAGVCRIDVWREQGAWQIIDTTYPTDAKGNLLSFIPFVIVGSDINDFSEQSIPLESIARLNLAHYRNSADYEDSVFRCGQVQPVISGISDARLRYLEDKDISIGSASALLLEPNSTFSFVQAGANTLASEAMDKKYLNMQHLGAKLIEPNKGNKTATQASQENSAQNSVASMCIVNLNEAMQKALSIIYTLSNMTTTEVLFKVKQEFINLDVEPSVLQNLSALVQAGLAPKEVIFDYLRKYNLINAELTNDDILGLIEADIPHLEFDDE